MVIDTSALIAILLNETEGKEFADAIGADQRRLLSSASLLEAGIVIEARKGPAGGRELDLLLHRARMEVVPLTVTQVEIAREAWRQFGRGNHRAGLNFGDCCAYALSKSSGEPLLYKGGDFAATDIRSAIL
jgi:ribonuclease VapC